MNNLNYIISIFKITLWNLISSISQRHIKVKHKLRNYSLPIRFFSFFGSKSQIPRAWSSGQRDLIRLDLQRLGPSKAQGRSQPASWRTAAQTPVWPRAPPWNPTQVPLPGFLLGFKLHVLVPFYPGSAPHFLGLKKRNLLEGHIMNHWKSS